ncbi:MAG: DUF2946 family protein [Sphingomonas sp.]|nr:DUF2946 family protein [Sphingomonas sp.]
MLEWRAFLRKQQQFAVLLVALALSVRALVPAGYMVAPSASKFLISICSGQGAELLAFDPGKHGDHQDGKKADHPCAFAGLGMPALGGADSVLLALALAFVLVAAFAPKRGPTPATPERLRPPLRAPPVFG